MEIEATRYQESDKAAWDIFAKESKNGLFFFQRDYMDYHAARFPDHSLIFRKKNQIVAIFPANEKGKEIHSHGGLTYGSLLISIKTKSVDVLEIFTAMMKYYSSCSFEKIIYKAIPYIFAKIPFQEDLYALFINNAKIFRRDISSVISIKNKLPLAKSPAKKFKDCSALNLTISQNRNFKNYWKLLTSVLQSHNAKPTHSLEEINLLSERFPDHIKLFEVYENNQLICGTVLFDFGNVIHTQYLANSQRGKIIGALDYLIIKLIEDQFRDREYFSFGISTENQGLYLNEGLINQKEMFGGRAVCHDFYEIALL
ncbi:GNAT family N-acetyltransferase [Chryseobacterium salviniae]|uniref:GNAT family N-acetyltransferase n=1 Tax=Chryseobacterium salviniae TaxID=3101750 RepID=A0ABU6HVV1_9FLAO|nr:GNAT family N-acetyltransferase [Chryseobacterium sp. T9W2-O]MEC3877201.1 GNAT family N-acetyltransferase [Chryseobacterium sp. T9W2-O]